MRLDDYLARPDSLSIGDLAAALGCDAAQIRQWKATAKMKRMPGAAYCVAIERATKGAVKRSDLRPDWKAIWPELVPAKRRAHEPSLATSRS